MQEAHKVYLLLGSNLGDRLHHLKFGLKMIEERIGKIQNKSSVYETQSWGTETPQPDYLNMAVGVITSLSPDKILSQLMAIEKRAGRKERLQNAPRTLDIDILLYDDLVTNTPMLTIPHPRLILRKFALQPLSEIAPQLIHPGLGKSIVELLLKTKDVLRVNIVDYV